MKTIKHLLVCAGLAISGGLSAQSHGTVKYKIEMESPSEQMRAQLAIMSGSKMTMFFDNENSRTDMSMGGISTTSIIHNENSDVVLTLTEIPMMGKKIATQTDTDEAAGSAPQVEIIKHGETKEILGYTCEKVTVIAEDGENSTENTYYVTQEISYNGHKNKYANFELGGFPLSMEIITETTGGQLILTITATEFSKEKPGEDKFSMEIPEGYDLMTEEEIKAMGQEMMGN